MLLICTAADSNVHIAYIKMQRCILYADMYIIYAEMCVIYEIYKHHLWKTMQQNNIQKYVNVSVYILYF